MQRTLIALLIGQLFSITAFAAEPSPTTPSSNKTAGQVFTLGQITVTGKKDNENGLTTSSLDRDDLWDYSKDGLADALSIVPGVTVSPGAGSRNEALINVRGFDRWRVPLMMDGIRIYLPADNRIDFDRFLTPDLSEIQVSKGYVSVINGPDGMGGTINLVTRKPTKELEGEVRVTSGFDSSGQHNSNTVYADVGTRQEKMYFQLSAEERDVKSWRLSKDFQSTKYEDGGKRNHVGSDDTRYNLKLGFTPNRTDEYSINYITQTGEKSNPFPATAACSNAKCYWDWPQWDTTSLYWLSHTQINDKTYIKTKAYYNTFKNTLAMYTNSSFSTIGTRSYYDDNAKGVNIEVGTDFFAQQTLKAAFHYRRDEHNEWNYTPSFTEPKQKTLEDVASIALEDTWHVTQKWDLIGGISRDARFSKQSQEYANNVLFDQPISNSFATNYQAAAIYRYSNTGKLHVSASDRTRFPTMFERFSSKFGGAVSNPWLKPERAHNYEIGIADNLTSKIRGEANVFYSKVDDYIQSVNITYQGNSVTQNQNIGQSKFKGIEFVLNAEILPTLEVGGNYSYLSTELSSTNNLDSLPPHYKAFLYAKWQPMKKLSIVPTIERNGSRITSSAANSNLNVETGSFTLVNIKADYQLDKNLDLSFAVRNLTDKNYQIVDGYPQEGRNYLISARYKF